MNNLAATVLAAGRWRPYLAPWYALAAGGLAVLGLPSGPTPFALLAGLVVLLCLLPDLSVRRGAWLAWLFGFSHFSFGFSWLLTSLHSHGEIPMPIALAMLLGLAAIMALYPALFGALLPALLRPNRTVPTKQQYWLLPLAAPALWTITEWLRSHLAGGFAWNLMGYSWIHWEAMIQVADVGGVLLLSWLTLLIASLVAMLWLRRSEWREIAGVSIMMTLIVGTVYWYGNWRLAELGRSQAQPTTATIRVAVVQGNIPQQMKWDPEHQDDTVARYLELSRNLPKPVDLVVWPETAMAFFLRLYPNYLKQINALIQETGIPVLTGAPMVDQTADKHVLYFNSMLLLDGSGSLQHRYDKRHLVPFGEFIPFRGWVPDSLQKLTEGAEDFTPGSGPAAISWDKGDIGPLICYEAIFPDEVRELALTGVKWLVNVTNDAWFGDTAKPQHLAMVQLRAIENRLPMIRAANTGISAVFDQLGRELARVDADRSGTLVVTLPQGSGTSWYRQHGPVWIWIWSGLCGISWILGRWLSQHPVPVAPKNTTKYG